VKREQALWAYLRRGLRGRWHAQRHEDRYAVGLPDVSYALDGVDGWLELKALDYAPVQVNVGLTAVQSAWLTLRGRAGNGQCFVLVRLGQEHLLFSWQARDLVHKIPVDVLRSMAVARWIRGIDFVELVRLLQGTIPHERW
jgi:hypothetical protein